MNEIIFLVEHDVEEGYVAQALGVSIITQADNLDMLKLEVRDAVHCHFPNEELRPKIIRLHIVQEEVIAS
ncbi:2-oxoisovalerate dehydrogenase E1 subunit beta [Laspinema palackyanum]|uniref:2-oxoisovalerate dehydrogenase E1 subunit beta n=1 Tax=Laspinema palackyanum TaxID=3231601 RepID=UPI00345D4E05|nr:2-oxoisovalerate dehydrogenase E1 subunit beta [Laspinema sp. D2c]